MKKIFSFFAIMLLCILGFNYADAQVTVTNPGNVGPSALSATYTSLALAITDLNTKTSISGPVTIAVDAANPQTAPDGGYSITALLTGLSSINTVTFEGNANTITASVGLTAGTLNDAIFKFIGSDFMIIQNFTMKENAANIINTPVMK